MTMETVLDSRERVRQIVGSLDHLATLPEITARIVATVGDPKSTAADLHKIISHDPALVARMLKLVNSSFYARAAKVDSVERAIVLLGFDAVHHLAIAATLGQLFHNVKLCDGFTAKDLWTHSVCVAVTARHLARQFARPVAEEAFLAGLVHDVGLLALLQVCPGELREVCQAAREYPTPFAMLELGIIGVDHQEVGSALASAWNFPRICQAATAHHHYPSLAEKEFVTVTACVHVADTLCCDERIGFYLSAATQLHDDVAFTGLVPLAAIEATKREVRELSAEAVRVFG